MPKKVAVTVRRSEKFWEAFLGKEKLCHAHSVRSLRSRYEGVLATKFDAEVEVQETLELPARMQQSLDQLLQDQEQLQELAVRVHKQRIAVAHELLGELGLGQVEAAALMGFSQSYLHKLLLDEGTEVQHTPRGRRPPTPR